MDTNSRKLVSQWRKQRRPQSAGAQENRRPEAMMVDEMALLSLQAKDGVGSSGQTASQSVRDGDYKDFTFKPDLCRKSRELDAQLARSQARQSRHEELYSMHSVYETRRRQLEEHYRKEQAKHFPFKPSLHKAKEGPQLPSAPLDSDESYGKWNSQASNHEITRDDNAIDSQDMALAASMFAGLEEGGWLQGDEKAEEALQRLHSSMSRLELSERQSSALRSKRAGLHDHAQAKGDLKTAPTSPALQLSADFAALLARDSFSTDTPQAHMRNQAPPHQRLQDSLNASNIAEEQDAQLSPDAVKWRQRQASILLSAKGKVKPSVSFYDARREEYDPPALASSAPLTLYEKGLEAKRRREHWSEEQKRVMRQKELQECSFWPETRRAKATSKTSPEKTGKSPKSLASSSSPSKASANKKKMSSSVAKNKSDSSKVFRQWAERGLEPVADGSDAGELVWDTKTRSWKRLAPRLASQSQSQTTSGGNDGVVRGSDGGGGSYSDMAKSVARAPRQVLAKSSADSDAKIESPVTKLVNQWERRKGRGNTSSSPPVAGQPNHSARADGGSEDGGYWISASQMSRLASQSPPSSAHPLSRLSPPVRSVNGSPKNGVGPSILTRSS